MLTKPFNFEKKFGRSTAIVSVVCLVVASLVILSNQRFPSRVYDFIRSLSTAHDKLDINQSESDFEPDLEDDGPRLPSDVVPKAYDLSIAANLSTMKFSGVVKITIKCKQPTDKIILNAKEMDIFQTNVTKRKAGKLLKIKDSFMKTKYEHYIIELEEELVKHKKYTIILGYTANVSKTLDGLYRSYYTTELGERRPLVATHLEQMKARKAFPCFDEPAMKAKFTLHISRDPTHQSLSNMPIDREDRKRFDMIVDHYVTTPPISTYLVAFMVMDFKYVETTSQSGVKIRVYAPPADKEKLNRALNISSQTLTFYEKLFGMKFPSKKLDIVAMPDMKETAMENWGLITIRREFVVDEENLMTTFSKEMTSGEIARALAHTWFGNLVTMKWWNEVWLKDGFSTFVTNLARYNIDKKTDWLALSTVLYWQSALDNDRSLYTVPLSNTKTTSKDTINSGVVYSKGAMIAKMVMNTLGPFAFLKGLKLYIRKNMYGNAGATDLWQSLSKFGKRLDLKQKMKSWTDLKSFPIVTLTRLKGPEKDLILAKQENFLEHRYFDVKTNARAVVKKPENNSSFDFQESEKITGSLWHIPLTYTVQSTAFKEYTVWLDKKWEKLSVLDPVGWIKANVRANGYYIVNYDKNNWIKLIKQLKHYHVVFSPSDRAGLIHDAFVLACEGIIDATIPLKLIIYMDKEDHYVPMEMMRLKSKCLQPLFKDTRMKNLYKQYLWYLQEHLLDKLGLEDNGGLLEKMNRDNTLVEAVNHRLDIKKKFQKIFQELKESKSSPSISPNLRKLALTYGFNKNNPKDWEYLWRVYEESSSDADRRFLHKSLSSFDEPELFSRTLENTLDLTKVRSQDTLLWLREISNNSTNEKIWNFMTKNWNTFRERFGDGGCLADLIHHIATTFQTSEKLNEVKEFLNSSGKNLMSQKLKERTIEEIKNNLLRKRDRNTNHISVTKAIKWLQRYMKKIAAKQKRRKENNKFV